MILEKRGISSNVDPEIPTTNANRYVLADITSFFTLLVGIYFPSVTGDKSFFLTFKGIKSRFYGSNAQPLITIIFKYIEPKRSWSQAIIGRRSRLVL